MTSGQNRSPGGLRLDIWMGQFRAKFLHSAPTEKQTFHRDPEGTGSQEAQETFSLVTTFPVSPKSTKKGEAGTNYHNVSGFQQPTRRKLVSRLLGTDPARSHLPGGHSEDPPSRLPLPPAAEPRTRPARGGGANRAPRAHPARRSPGHRGPCRRCAPSGGRRGRLPPASP